MKQEVKKLLILNLPYLWCGIKKVDILFSRIS